MPNQKKKTRSQSDSASAASQQRRIQKGVDAKDKKEGSKNEPAPAQLGARKYPAPPFPTVHERVP